MNVNFELIEDGKGMTICIYDADYSHKAGKYGFCKLGQFVSSYYTETFLSIDKGAGLNLHGGVSKWKLSPEQVQQGKALILEASN